MRSRARPKVVESFVGAGERAGEATHGRDRSLPQSHLLEADALGGRRKVGSMASCQSCGALVVIRRPRLSK